MTQEAIATHTAPSAPAKRTLASIVTEMLDALEESGGEVSAALDEMSAELTEKAQAYAAVLRQMQAEQKAFEDLAATYKAKAEAREQTIVGLRFRMDHALKACGLEKLKTPTASWYYQSSKRVEIQDETGFLEFADDRFVETKRYPNKTAIKKALEAGEQVEGAALAESKHLRVR